METGTPRPSLDPKLNMDGLTPPELPGFANQNGFFNFLSDSLFKFADLDKIPGKDVNTILQILKK